MADNTPNEPAETPPVKAPGIMTLVKGVAIVSVIVLLEVVVGSMMIPTADETVAIAEKIAAGDAHQEADPNGDGAETTGEAAPLALGDMNEVSLGTFNVLNYDTETGSRVNVDFELFGTVLADEESDFFPLFDANQHRIREQIQIAVRSADATDLSDAGLGLIKRKILETTNRTLGRPLLHEAIFSKFSFQER